jgi:hypothetical protein
MENVRELRANRQIEGNGMKRKRLKVQKEVE